MDGDYMKSIIGILDKIRVINSAPLLLRFTIETPSEYVNCVTAKKDIIDKMLLLPEKQYVLEVTGRYNKRKQVVVNQISIVNPDDTIRRLGIY